jgi:hypothetical protein
VLVGPGILFDCIPIRSYTDGFIVSVGMSPTVSELRNEIRLSVGRFEREVNASFTKEELAAIADVVGFAAEANGRPSKSVMRSGIRWRVGLSESPESAEGSSFSKAELEAIADTLNADG